MWYYGNAKGVHITLDTSGIDKLLAAVDPRAEKVLDIAAHTIEKEWKENITIQDAVDTGAYRSSVHVEETAPLERVIADGVEYGIYVECGSSSNGMPARPCAMPAVEKERPRLLAAWKELFE